MGIRHVVAGITIVTGGLLTTACDWEGVGGTTVEDREKIRQDVSEVRFSNDSGAIKITTGDTTEVRWTVRYGDEKPGKSFRLDGDALILEACPVRDCKIDYEVTVPAGTKVSGHVDSGTVELTGVASANVQAESGELTVRDVDGEVNASAQSGNVDLAGIGGAVVASAESGNVTVGLAAAQSVSVRTESGNIEVAVPDGKYQVTTSVDSGRVDNEVGNDPFGHKIDLRAESGNVNIRRA
jgi:hypothetical protein